MMSQENVYLGKGKHRTKPSCLPEPSPKCLSWVLWEIIPSSPDTSSTTIPFPSLGLLSRL